MERYPDLVGPFGTKSRSEIAFTAMSFFFRARPTIDASTYDAIDSGTADMTWNVINLRVGTREYYRGSPVC